MYLQCKGTTNNWYIHCTGGTFFVILHSDMTYEETIAYLYASQPAFHLSGASAYKPGPENILRLLQHLGNPHLRFRSVHVAGTNGKGSTSHLLAAVLQSAGYKTGLYTSPHLVDFRERIRIGGVPIPKDDVVAFVAANRSFLTAVRPSFFETATAMAFWYFAKERVDVAVVETGLGGRLDSTNVITPLVSVITNIGRDHTEFLGTTLPLIASEKAGIIKAGVPVVIGETQAETAPVFCAKAAEMQSPIVFADQQPQQDIPCQLTGVYQRHNKQTARVAVEVLCRCAGLKVTPGQIADGYARVCTLTGLRGRWETLSEAGPVIVCDTGHNAHGIRYVAEQLHDCLCRFNRLRVVFGMVSDKDVEDVMRLLPVQAVYYFCQAGTRRAIPAEEMCRMGAAAGLQGKACGTVREALECALSEATEGDMVFVGGSNYVVGEVLNLPEFSDVTL